MCYACGHYTVLRPFRLNMETRSGYVHIVAETNVVSGAFLHYVLDDIERAGIRPQGQYLKLLLEVVAPEIAVSPMQALDVFRRAVKLGLRGAQVAYVISGRPWSITAALIEKIARQQGLHLRFFVHRDSALSWLNAADEAGRIA